MDYKQIVGQNLQDMLDAQGKSKRELARYLGVTPTIVTYWTNGVNQIRTKHYDKICEFLHCSKADLLLDRENPDLMFPASYSVPILGDICAGSGVICEEDYQGQFFVDRSIRADYCLKVKGDSMSPLIKDGDIAFIQKGSNFPNGTICAVIVGEDVSLKKVYVTDKEFMLVPINTDYVPVSTTEAVIIGQCIGHYQPLL